MAAPAGGGSHPPRSPWPWPRPVPFQSFEKQQKLWDDAGTIDLFYWIDAHTKTVRHVVNKDGLRHREACVLMNIAA
jgi:hypothetical protein